MLNGIVYKSRSLNDTKIIARMFAKRFLLKQNRVIVLLQGELGSGKTTFTRYTLNCLGISDKDFEGSPTFTIVNEYGSNIFHIDLYRLNKKDEVDNIGLFEILDKKGIFFIEWPKLFDIKADVIINFRAINDNTRMITIDRF